MTIRRIANIAVSAASAALTATVLTAGTSFAQSPSAGSFEAQLNEAKSVGMLDVSRDTRSTVATHLSIAESLYTQGNVARAEPTCAWPAV